jgi:hypothetical protein
MIEHKQPEVRRGDERLSLRDERLSRRDERLSL